MAYEVELTFAKELAKAAGDIMRRYFRSEDNGTELKSDKTLVTLADTEINSLVIARVKEQFPNHSVHGEEEKLHVEKAEYTWVCDPVDGTMPFAKGIPISSFSLALVNRNGESEVGVVYDPFQDRLFEAVKGGGAYLNSKKIHVSNKVDMDTAYIDEELWINETEGISFDDPKDVLAKEGAKVTTQCSAVIMGCFVAMGVYDALLFGQSKPEDIAALAVIVTEAGGKVTDLLGREQRYDQRICGAVVSNGFLHPKLVDITSSINYQNTPPGS